MHLTGLQLCLSFIQAYEKHDTRYDWNIAPVELITNDNKTREISFKTDETL